MAEIFSDDFSSGLGSWTQQFGTWSIDTGRVKITALSSGWGTLEINSVSEEDLSLEAVVRSSDVSAVAYPALFVRGTKNASDYDGYFFYPFNGAGGYGDRMSLYRHESGYFTALGDRTWSPADDTDYTVKVEVSGTTLKLYEGGVQKGSSFSDSYITGAGTAGCHTESTIDTGFRWDDIVVDDLTGGSTKYGTSAGVLNIDGTSTATKYRPGIGAGILNISGLSTGNAIKSGVSVGVLNIDGTSTGSGGSAVPSFRWRDVRRRAGRS